MKERIERNFKYYKPDAMQISIYQDIRNKAKDLALFIDMNCPDGRERSLAFTKVEEAVMWANASIARSGGGDEGSMGKGNSK